MALWWAIALDVMASLINPSNMYISNNKESQPQSPWHCKQHTSYYNKHYSQSRYLEYFYMLLYALTHNIKNSPPQAHRYIRPWSAPNLVVNAIVHISWSSVMRCKYSAPTTTRHPRGICGKPGFLGGVGGKNITWRRINSILDKNDTNLPFMRQYISLPHYCHLWI